jgi:hypothetical protein
MKKILSLLLVLTMVLCAFVACTPATPDAGNNNTDNGNNNTDNTPAEKTYTLALAVDTTIGKNNKVSNTALVLVIDADNKIVAARVDSAEATPALDEAGALVPQESVQSKVEKGDAYTGMAAGSWANQAAAFEAWLVGKTAADVAGTDFTGELIAGCTMTSSMATFKALVAEAFASTTKVTFKTTESIKTGLALSTSVASGKGGKVTVSTDVAALAIVGDKVAATAIDSIEQSFTIEEVEGAKTLVAADLKGSKTEQGDSYTMPAGSWTKQAAAFSNSTVGKTVAELANLEVVSDALAAAGCTMQNTTAGYKATIIKAAGYAK